MLFTDMGRRWNDAARENRQTNGDVTQRWRDMIVSV